MFLFSLILLSLSFICLGATSGDFGYEAGMGKQRETAGTARGRVPGHFPCSWTGRGMEVVTGVILLCQWQDTPNSELKPLTTLQIKSHFVPLHQENFGAAAGVEQ